MLLQEPPLLWIFSVLTLSWFFSSWTTEHPNKVNNLMPLDPWGAAGQAWLAFVSITSWLGPRRGKLCAPVSNPQEPSLPLGVQLLQAAEDVVTQSQAHSQPFRGALDTLCNLVSLRSGHNSHLHIKHDQDIPSPAFLRSPWRFHRSL